MTIQEILDAITKEGVPEPGIAQVPSPELIAFFVRWVRSLRGWKRETLASFSQVSLSTIERVERAERVSSECLDRIATGLGYEGGYLTTPRLSSEDNVARFAETWGYLEPVPVRLLHTQAAIRGIGACHAFLTFRSEANDDPHEVISELGEWLETLSFTLGHPNMALATQGRRRKILIGALDCVRRLNNAGFHVLGGVMNAPQPGIPDWQIGVITITPKKTDPGAVKRRHVLVDRRWAAQLPQENNPAALTKEFAQALARTAMRCSQHASY